MEFLGIFTIIVDKKTGQRAVADLFRNDDYARLSELWLHEQGAFHGKETERREVKVYVEET